MQANFNLAELVTPWVFGYLAVFCRAGGAFMAFPGFGDAHAPQHVRLGLAFAVSLPVAMVVPGLPLKPPAEIGGWISVVGANLMVGIFFGICGRLLLSSLHVAGQAIGQVIGIFNPFGANVPGFEGASTVSALLLFSGVVIVFAADIHHLLIEALVGSFEVIPITGWPDMGAKALATAKTAMLAMRMAAQFAAPFLVIALVFNTGMGIANRLMPGLQVYFVFSPALLFVGFLLLGLVCTAVMLSFAGTMAEFVSGL